MKLYTITITGTFRPDLTDFKVRYNNLFTTRKKAEERAKAMVEDWKRDYNWTPDGGLEYSEDRDFVGVTYTVDETEVEDYEDTVEEIRDKLFVWAKCAQRTGPAPLFDTMGKAQAEEVLRGLLGNDVVNELNKAIDNKGLSN